MSHVRFGLIVPTFNPGPAWQTFLASLDRQSLQPQRKLIIDSASHDQTVAQALQSGFEVLSIDSKDFNHGGTRQQGVDFLDDCDLLLFVTQDIVFADPDAIAHLLTALQQSDVGAAYGRQLPFDHATLDEHHARSFNYPGQSQLKSLEDRDRLGIKTAFISNSFAAYRREVLAEAGGFPLRLIFGEDMYVGAKLLLSGWKIAYCSEAAVYHSHNQSLWRVMRRSFDNGVFHACEPWLLEEFTSPEGEGFRFVASALRTYLRERPTAVLQPVFANGLRFLAYRLGRLHRYWPLWFNRFFSLNRSYWTLG